ncbi:MAG: hypothetical protein DWQ01_12145 [Planctomycetota bacterium]|nr:MAG: hypothetical protein DWQ01_12145 [Planctomycetota bacterium]
MKPTRFLFQARSAVLGFWTSCPLFLGILVFPSMGTAQCFVERMEMTGTSTLHMRGKAVSISGDLAAVGQPSFDTNENASVVLYRQREGGGRQWDIVRTYPDKFPFGQAVLVEEHPNGSLLIIGDPSVNDNSHGQVAVYRGPSWDQAAHLSSSRSQQGDNFGTSLGYYGDIAAVGSPDATNHGVVTLFSESSDWAEIGILEPNQAENGERSGAAVDIHADFVVVGAPGASAGDGKIYFFKRLMQGGWSELQQFSGIAGAALGSSVAFSDGGQFAFVGAPQQEEPGGGVDTGAVLVFEQQGGWWNLLTTLYPSTPADGAEFGASIATRGDSLLIGAPAYDTTGAAFVWRSNQGEITQLNLGNHSGSRFGAAVSVFGDQYLIGAPGVFNEGKALMFLELNGFTVLGPDPAIAGINNTISAVCTWPGSQVIFYYSPQPGTTPLNLQACPDLHLSLDQAVALGLDDADSQGIATLGASTPPSLTGVTLSFQAVDLTHCQVSNRVQVQFQ